MAKDTGPARRPTRRCGGYTGSTDAVDVPPPSRSSETYAHDPDCNTDHEARPEPCPPPRDAETPDMAARPFDELRGSGLLWLINRVVFHPRGFALALHVEGGEVVGWSLQGDGAEVWQFADPEDEPFGSAEATFRAARAPHA